MSPCKNVSSNRHHPDTFCITYSCFRNPYILPKLYSLSNMSSHCSPIDRAPRQPQVSSKARSQQHKTQNAQHYMACQWPQKRLEQIVSLRRLQHSTMQVRPSRTRYIRGPRSLSSRPPLSHAHQLRHDNASRPLSSPLTVTTNTNFPPPLGSTCEKRGHSSKTQFNQSRTCNNKRSRQCLLCDYRF